MKRLLIPTFIFLMGLVYNSFADTLTVTADRSTLSVDETLQIKVRFDEQVFLGDLDTTPLEKDFEVLTTSRQQQYSSVNGKKTSFTDWNIILQPRKVGTLTIPALEFDGAQSAPVAIQVTPARVATSGQQGEPLFVEATISDQSIHVQQQLILTYRLHMAVPLQNISMSEINIPNVEIFKLDENRYQKKLTDRTYQVIEVSFALFPQKSGDLLIPASRFEGYMPSTRNDPFFGSMMNNGKRFRLSTDSFTIDVKDKPSHSTDYWLPAQNIVLREQWSGDQDQWRVGEPVTRTMTITGQGVTASQLPEIKVDETDHYRVYPDQAKSAEEPRPTGMMAQRIESIAFVPSKAGLMVLPPVSVQWWDTSSNQLRTETLPGKTVTVLASTTQTYSPQVTTPQQQLPTESHSTPPEANPLWLKISIALNALLLLLVFRLMQRQPVSADSTSEKNASATSATAREKILFNAILASAKANNPQQLQQNILHWAQHRWPQQHLKTVADFASFCGQQTLQEQLQTLSDNLYGNQNKNIDLMVIAREIKTLRANGLGSSNNTTEGLKPLYPTA